MRFNAITAIDNDSNNNPKHVAKLAFCGPWEQKNYKGDKPVIIFGTSITTPIYDQPWYVAVWTPALFWVSHAIIMSNK